MARASRGLGTVVLRGVLAAVVVTIGAMPLAGPPAAGQEQGEDGDDMAHRAVDMSVTRPGSPAGGGSPAGPGNGAGGSTEQPACVWRAAPNQDAARASHPDAPPEAVVQYYDCGQGPGPIRHMRPNLRAAGGALTFSNLPTRWVLPGQARPAPPSPAVLASQALARVEALMVAPRLATSPAPGTAGIVGVPTFVEVTNWQGPLTDEECVLGVCIELTATPTLTWEPGERGEPGEPDAPTIECSPPGSRYDPAGEDAQAQADEPGACAYQYQRRTGVAGRPDAWPGEVRVEWEVTWTSDSGVSGAFDPVVLSTELPRPVDEVQAVVTDGSLGASLERG